MTDDGDLLAPGARIKWAMKQKGLPVTAPALAKLCGFVESTARSYLNGSRGPKRLPMRAAITIGRKLDVSAEWLSSGEGERVSSSGLTEDATMDRPLVQLPVITQVKTISVWSSPLAGPHGEIELADHKAHQILVTASVADVDGAYGMEVPGECMRERFKPGDTVIVHPNMTLRAEDDVVIQLKSESDKVIYGIVKRFVRQTEDELVVKQLNPLKEIHYPRSRIIAVHRIVDVKLR